MNKLKIKKIFSSGGVQEGANKQTILNAQRCYFQVEQDFLLYFGEQSQYYVDYSMQCIYLFNVLSANTQFKHYCFRFQQDDYPKNGILTSYIGIPDFYLAKKDSLLQEQPFFLFEFTVCTFQNYLFVIYGKKVAYDGQNLHNLFLYQQDYEYSVSQNIYILDVKLPSSSLNWVQLTLVKATECHPNFIGTDSIGRLNAAAIVIDKSKTSKKQEPILLIFGGIMQVKEPIQDYKAEKDFKEALNVSEHFCSSIFRIAPKYNQTSKKLIDITQTEWHVSMMKKDNSKEKIRPFCNSLAFEIKKNKILLIGGTHNKYLVPLQSLKIFAYTLTLSKESTTGQSQKNKSSNKSKNEKAQSQFEGKWELSVVQPDQFSNLTNAALSNINKNIYTDLKSTNPAPFFIALNQDKYENNKIYVKLNNDERTEKLKDILDIEIGKQIQSINLKETISLTNQSYNNKLSEIKEIQPSNSINTSLKVEMNYFDQEKAFQKISMCSSFSTNDTSSSIARQNNQMSIDNKIEGISPAQSIINKKLQPQFNNQNTQSNQIKDVTSLNSQQLNNINQQNQSSNQNILNQKAQDQPNNRGVFSYQQVPSLAINQNQIDNNFNANNIYNNQTGSATNQQFHARNYSNQIFPNQFSQQQQIIQNDNFNRSHSQNQLAQASSQNLSYGQNQLGTVFESQSNSYVNLTNTPQILKQADSIQQQQQSYNQLQQGSNQIKPSLGLLSNNQQQQPSSKFPYQNINSNFYQQPDNKNINLEKNNLLVFNPNNINNQQYQQTPNFVNQQQQQQQQQKQISLGIKNEQVQNGSRQGQYGKQTIFQMNQIKDNQGQRRQLSSENIHQNIMQQQNQQDAGLIKFENENQQQYSEMQQNQIQSNNLQNQQQQQESNKQEYHDYTCEDQFFQSVIYKDEYQKSEMKKEYKEQQKLFLELYKNELSKVYSKTHPGSNLGILHVAIIHYDTTKPKAKQIKIEGYTFQDHHKFLNVQFYQEQEILKQEFLENLRKNQIQQQFLPQFEKMDDMNEKRQNPQTGEITHSTTGSESKPQALNQLSNVQANQSSIRNPIQLQEYILAAMVPNENYYMNYLYYLQMSNNLLVKGPIKIEIKINIKQFQGTQDKEYITPCPEYIRSIQISQCGNIFFLLYKENTSIFHILCCRKSKDIFDSNCMKFDKYTKYRTKADLYSNIKVQLNKPEFEKLEKNLQDQEKMELQILIEDLIQKFDKKYDTHGLTLIVDDYFIYFLSPKVCHSMISKEDQVKYFETNPKEQEIKRYASHHISLPYKSTQKDLQIVPQNIDWFNDYNVDNVKAAQSSEYIYLILDYIEEITTNTYEIKYKAIPKFIKQKQQANQDLIESDVLFYRFQTNRSLNKISKFHSIISRRNGNKLDLLVILILQDNNLTDLSCAFSFTLPNFNKENNGINYIDISLQQIWPFTSKYLFMQIQHPTANSFFAYDPTKPKSVWNFLASKNDSQDNFLS